MPENLGLRTAFGVEVNANQDITKWYRVSGNFNFFQQETSGIAYGESLDATAISFSTRISNNLKFKDFMNFQINFNYRAPQTRPQGIRRSITVLDLGFSKDLWKKKGSLALSVRDVFNSRKYRFDTETSNYTAESEWQWRRGPQAVMTLTYRLNQKPGRRGGRGQGGGYSGGSNDRDF